MEDLLVALNKTYCRQVGMHGDYNPGEFINDHQYAHLDLSLTHDFLGWRYVIPAIFNTLSWFITASVVSYAICVKNSFYYFKFFITGGFLSAQ
ncbi:MAG: hypothetical protein EBX50_20205 [Chitinophagia bacterium]|nr:hypothetical protein [Chitinophagia bacterium]